MVSRSTEAGVQRKILKRSALSQNRTLSNVEYGVRKRSMEYGLEYGVLSVEYRLEY